MANIKPFRGIRFNCSLIDDPGKVITPPYDVINDHEQDKLHSSSPYNIVRLEYGKILPGDNEDNNRYTRAAELLNNWLDTDILLLEDKQSYYLYEQHFSYHNTPCIRRGIAAALKLQPYEDNVILPHERTMTGPKADRLELLKATRTNTSPIFTLYPDPENRVEDFFQLIAGKEPVFESKEHDGQFHRLWKITDSSSLSEITTYIQSQPLLIADGHHRYETALDYSRLLIEGHEESAGYILTFMVSMQDPGLLVLPTHRLLSGLSSEQQTSLKRIIDNNFSVHDYGNPSDLNRTEYFVDLKNLSVSNNGFGFITHGQVSLLTPKNDMKYPGLSLPVDILHKTILQPLLAPGEKSEVDKDLITYPHDLDSAIDSVLYGSANAAFILDTVPVEEVLKHSRAGNVMPQKTTFFFPKLPGGLVLYNMDHGF